MWNWMSAAGRPPRVRVNATTSATVEVSGPLRRSSHSASRLGPVPAVERALVRDLPDHRHERVVLQVAPDSRQVVAHLHAGRLQLAGRADARQQQQLRRVDRAGAQQHLALGAHELLASAPRAQAHADRPVSLELDAEHVAFVRTSRLGRLSAGRRKASAALKRWPLRCVTWNIAAPSCSGPL